MSSRLRSFFAAATAAAVLVAASLPAVARAEVTKPHPGMTVVRHAGQGAMIVLDLCAPGASIVTTRYADRKATPAQWASPKGFEAATNADFFDNPGWTYVIGRARADGEDWPANAQWKEKDRPYWQFGPGIVEGIANGLTPPRSDATQIIGGHNVIISGGKTTGPWSPANDGALLNGAYARTAFGASADRRTVYALTTSDRVSAQALVNRMQAWAAEAKAPPVDFATNMDGGGSSQMYVKGQGQIVSTGRQVNNHIGFLAKGGAAPSPMCLPRFAGAVKAQSFPRAPEALRMKVGDVVDGYVELTNTGTATWSPGKTKLAPIPRDEPSRAGGAGWLAPNRVSTIAAPVKPGEVGRFPVKLAPTSAGDWVQHFGLVEEGVTWFADKTVGGGPSDSEIAVHLVVADENGVVPPPEVGGSSGDPDGDRASFADERSLSDDDAEGCAVSARSRSQSRAASVLLAGVAIAALSAASRRARRRGSPP